MRGIRSSTGAQPVAAASARMRRGAASVACALLFLLAATAAGTAQPAPRPDRLDPLLLALVPSAADAAAAVPPDAVSIDAALADRLSLSTEIVPGVASVLVVVVGTASPAALQAAGFVEMARVGDVVAGWAPVHALAALSALPQIEHIGPSLPVASDAAGGVSHAAGFRLDLAAPETHAEQLRRLTDMKGQGVLVAIFDTGIDFAHEDFVRPDGSTRVLRLLDLSDTQGPSAPGFPAVGGSFYTREQIDAALASGVGVRQVDQDGHGTHVAGIAAASGRAAGGGVAAGTMVGIAPEADLLVIRGTRPGSGGFQTADIIAGLAIIEAWAAEIGRPWVANFSLGSHMGPHDGSLAHERAVDNVVGTGRPGRVVVISGGNNGGSRLHTTLPLDGPTAARRIVVPNFVPGTGTDAMFVTIWYPGSATASLEIVTPTGIRLGPVGTGQTLVPGQPTLATGTTDGAVFISNAFGGPSPLNGDREIVVQLFSYVQGGVRTNVRPGEWRLEVTGGGGVAHAWMQNAGAVNGAFHASDAVDSHLTGSPGNARNAITVAAHTTRVTWTDIDGIARTTAGTVGDIAPFSSPGPTRDGRQKPEISAPGHRTITALSSASNRARSGLAGPRHLVLSGTSMSAPAVTGIVALMLQHDATLDADAIRQRLRATARSDAFTGGVWNARFGDGKVDAVEAVRAGLLAGDVNGDGVRDIADAVTIVNHVLGRTQLTPEQKLLAEMTIDGEINVADAVGVVNRILTPTAASVAAADARSRRAAQVRFDTAEPVGAAVSMTVALRADAPIAGFQFDVEYAGTGIAFDAPRPAARAQGLRLDWHDDGGRLRVVGLATGGAGIAAGEGPVVHLPVRATDASGTGAPRLARLIAADLDGRLLTGAQADAGTADRIAQIRVYGNRPNPLRAGTGTRFVLELPGAGVDATGTALPVTAAAALAGGPAGGPATRVSVNVYNVRGQLVRRVYDGALPPGRFVVEWDGAGEAGARLAAGIYVAEVVAGPVREALRMILVDR